MFRAKKILMPDVPPPRSGKTSLWLESHLSRLAIGMVCTLGVLVWMMLMS